MWVADDLERLRREGPALKGHRCPSFAGLQRTRPLKQHPQCKKTGDFLTVVLRLPPDC